MPPWLQGQISREESEDLVRPFEDGKFVVRERAEGGHVLCVVYRGKPTHHLIAPDDSGILKVNRKDYGSSTENIEELIAFLESPPPGSGWPVALRQGDSNSSGNGRNLDKAPVERAGSSTRSKEIKWMHPPMDKENAERILSVQNLKDGRFIARPRGEDHPKDFVLSIVFRGKPTHHLVSPNGSGELTVNKKSYGNFKTIKQLVLGFAYEDLPEGWPVRLTEYVTTDEVVAPLRLRNRFSQRSSTGSKQDSKTNDDLGRPPLARTDSTTSRGSGGSTRSEPSADDVKKAWLHPIMSNGDASDLINGKIDGHFIVRNYTVEDQFVISVMYRGRPTHHLVIAPPQSVSSVNKKETGVYGIVDTIGLLRNKQPFWPVPLLTHTNPSTAAETEDDISRADEERRERDDSDRRRADENRRAEERREEEARKLREAKEAEEASKSAKEARRREEEAAAKRQAEAEVERQRREEEAAAKRQEEAEEERRRQEEEAAAENEITGFYELDDPFPVGDEEDNTDENYLFVAPTATTLVQAARELARQQVDGGVSQIPLRQSIGKILNLENIGQSSTEDPDSNTSSTLFGRRGSEILPERFEALEKQMELLLKNDQQKSARIASLEKEILAFSGVKSMRGEIQQLRKKNAELEKKILLLENIMLSTQDENGLDSHVFLEIRIIKREGFGSRSAAPKLTDLAHAKLIGKTRVLKGSTYAEVRANIVTDFDEDHVPNDFKFYTISDDENTKNLIVIHGKQEIKTPVDDAVVYVYDSTPRSAENQASAAMKLWSSKTRPDNSWVKGN